MFSLPLAIAFAATLPASQTKPNIILFVCDDLGLREVGAYGLKHAKTPHLDQLAKEGTKFNQFRSGSPVCAPSRATLLTGKHTGHVAIRGNKEVGGWNFNDKEGQMPLSAKEVTLPKLLKQGGYDTGAFGKWGLGGPMSEGHPLNQGFDRFFGYLCQRQAHNHYPNYLWNNQFVYFLPDNPTRGLNQATLGALNLPKPTDSIPDSFFEQFKGKQYAPDVIEDHAIAWLKEKRSKPFFMYFPIALPHTALQAPDDLVQEFPREWDTLPYITGNGYLPNKRPKATYAAMLKKIDDSMGRIRKTLLEVGADKNTIIIFTSDNGATFLKQVDTEFFGSTAGLKGKKGSVYDGGLRVPMIIYRPGQLPAQTSNLFWYMPDILPTVLGMANIPLPKGIDGKRADALFNSPFLSSEMYWEYPEGNHSQAAILDGRWKAVRSNLATSLEIEIYDLSKDESESTNLADAHPDLVARAKNAMAKAHRPNSNFKLNRIDPDE